MKMTNEEAIRELKAMYEHILPHMSIMGTEAYDLAIKALEQQPCEDCISRQAVLDIIYFEDKWLYDAKSHNADTKIVFSGLESRVKALPSVTPKGVTITDFTDKCRECGRIKPCEDCISREAVMKCFKKWQPYMATRLLDYEQELKELPSVTPTSDAKERDKE